MIKTALLATTALLAASTLAAGDSVTHHFSATAARGGVRRIVVDVPAGSVHVRNGAGDTIVATGTVRREYDSDSDRIKQQRVVDDIGVDIYVSKDGAIVGRKLGEHARGWSARNNSDYELTLDVPAGIDLDIQTRAGEVHLDGSFGSVHADLRAGEIHANLDRASVRDLTASVRVGEVHADTGDRTIDNEGVFPKEVHWRNPNGGTATVDLHATAGEVHVKRK